MPLPTGYLPYDESYDITPELPPGALPYSEPEQTWGDWISNDVLTGGNALRYGIPAVAAGVSYLTAPMTLGGSLALNIGSGAAGEAAARWYEDKPFDLGVTATEGVLNALPVKKLIPGSGLLSRMGQHAITGAWQGAAGSIPRHLADEGTLFSPSEWTMPSAERVGAETLAGAGLNTLIGGGFEGIHGLRDAPPARPIEATPPPPAAANLPPPRWDAGLGGRGDYGNVTPPLDYNMPKGDSGSLQIPFDFDTHQPNLPLGPYRAPSGRMTNTGPALPPKFGPPVGELPIQQGAGQMPLDFGGGEQQNLFPFTPPPNVPPTGGAPVATPPQAPPTNVDPLAPRFTADRKAVIIPAPSAAINDMLRSQGYVPVPMRGPGGEVMMVLGADAPRVLTGDLRPQVPPAPVAPPTTGTSLPGAIGPGEVAAGDVHVVPTAKVNQTYVNNMKAGGYKVGSTDAINTYFIKDPAAEVSFQRDFGDEGNPVQPGEETGRVAPFTPKPPPYVDPLAGMPPVQPNIPTRGSFAAFLTDKGIIPEQLPILPPEVQAQLRTEYQASLSAMNVSSPEPPPLAPSNIPPMDPRMAERVEASGQREFGPRTSPQQGNLMPMEVGNAPGMSEKDMLNLRASRLIDTSFGQPLNEPRQMSMMGDFMDAEIGQHMYDQGMAGKRDEFGRTRADRIAGPEFGPKVKEYSPYPEGFEPQREGVELQAPRRLVGAARISATQKLYDSLKSFVVGGTKRKTFIHDSGSRLTPEEFKAITGSPHMKELLKVYESIQEDIAKAVGRPDWADRLEGVGILLDSGAHGVHIPNGTTGKSSIGINPFSRMKPGIVPKHVAWNNVMTNLHEFAHVGHQIGSEVRLSESDFNDPRVGEFLSSYMKQVTTHTDPQTGHGLDFSNRLSEVYAKFGVERTFAAAARIESALTGGNKSGRYSPEIQRLLHSYNESRGRGATVPDYLARSTTQQTDRGSNGERGIPGDTQTDRDGAADGVNQLFYEENDHPEVAKFRALSDARGFKDTRFILPDGTRKTHNDHIHEFAARRVGSSLTDALPAGVLRFTEDGAGAEIGKPLTYAQAQQLKDAIAHQAGPSGNNFSRFYVDMRMPDGDIRSVGLDERMSTAGIKNRIAQYYSPEGVAKPYEGFSQESVSPEDLAMDKNDSSAWRKIKENAGWGQGVAGKKQKGEVDFIDEVMALSSAATTTLDFSAPGRQGLSMILTPQFWKAGAAMFKGLSKEGFDRIDAELKAKPLFQRKIDANTGAVIKSTGEQIGMKLFRPASEVGERAEGIASRWLETGGSIPFVSAMYRHSIGKAVRMSNRAYITFLNHLNANRTEFLMDKAREMAVQAFDTGSARPGFFKQKFTPQEAVNLNPYQNLQLGKDIADFVNTATGHGPLKTHLYPHKSGEVSLEGSAGKLGKILFSPGLIASRIRMLNPNTYIMAPPFVRKQYVKAALSTVGAWTAFTELSKMAGAEVSDEPTSADFGKVRIGDTRIDPGGGFLQFVVAANRMYQGGYTSSATGEFHRFGEGFQAETQLSNLMRFGSNKLNPIVKFAYDVANASEYNPFHVKDRTAQLFVPLFVQDIVDVASKNPEMIPWLAPMMFGVGAQTYSKGESVGKLINPENDWLATGGGVADLGPDYIHPKLDY